MMQNIIVCHIHMVLHTLHRDQRAQHMYDQGGSVCRSSLARMAKAFHTVLWAMFLLQMLPLPPLLHFPYFFGSFD